MRATHGHSEGTYFKRHLLLTKYFSLWKFLKFLFSNPKNDFFFLMLVDFEVYWLLVEGFSLSITILDVLGGRSWQPQKWPLFWGVKLHPTSTSKIVTGKENPSIKSFYTSKSTHIRKKKSVVPLLSENSRNFHNEEYFVRSKCPLKYVPSEWPWVAAYHGIKSRY